MNNKLRKKIGSHIKQIFAAFTGLLLMSNVFAMTLDDAKSAGLVGEQANGYLGIVSASAGSEIKALVEDINSKRKTKYEEIASSKNIPLSQVEELAGAKVIERANPGEYVKSGSSWTKK